VHPVPQGFFLSKKEQIDWVVKHPNPPGRIARFEKLVVRIYGDTAIANGIVSARKGANEQPNRSIFSDIFVRHAGRWQAVNAQEPDIKHPIRPAYKTCHADRLLTLR
jgi:hypothetical protein